MTSTNRAVTLSYRPVVMELATPLATAHGSIERRASWLVRATRLDGSGPTAGYGEAAPLPGFGGGDPAGVVDALEAIARGVEHSGWEGLPGELVRMEQAWLERPRDTAARAGAAFALADLAAREAGLSLAGWLAGAGGSTAEPTPAMEEGIPLAMPAPGVLVNGVIGATSREVAATEARRLVELGYGTLKVKVGGDPDTDVDRVRAVRVAVGDRIRLRLDANEGWTTEQALGAIERLAAFDIEYLEQPVARDDIDGLARLRRRAVMAIAADEALLEPGGPDEVLAAAAADVWVMKPVLLGGPFRTLELASRAAELGVPCVVTTAVDGGIGRLCALHVAAVIAGKGWDGGLAHGLGTGGLMGSNLVKTPEPEKGRMHVPAGPGLGCDGPEGPWTGLGAHDEVTAWLAAEAVADLEMQLTPARLLVVFDGTCGFCTECAFLVQRLDRHGRVAWQTAQADGLAALVGLTPDELGGASWAIAPDGRMVSGADAIAASLDWALGLGGVLGRLVDGPLRRPAGAVYTWVAINRVRFPGRAYLDDHAATLSESTALEIGRRLAPR